MTELNVPVPASLEAAMLSRIDEGGFVDAGEYVRDLVRRDLAAAQDARRWLQAMIDEGIASGTVDREPEDVLDEIMAEDPDLRD